MSTITFLSHFEDAALTTERIALAIFPCFPIIFPTSSVATFNSKTIVLSVSFSVTTTSSGESTSAFAIVSTHSFIVRPPDYYFSIPAI